MKAPHQDESELNNFDEVFQFAADMEGAGYIFIGDSDMDIMHNSVLVNLNVEGRSVKFKTITLQTIIRSDFKKN